MNFITKLWEGLFGRTRPPKWVQTPTEDDASTDPGYFQLPGSRQWSPPPAIPNPVNEAGWKPCHACGRKIPVVMDETLEDGQIKSFGTWTCVCPFCGASHVGTPVWSEEKKRQEKCHECDAAVGELYQCPTCWFPRGWMRVDCPNCGKPHPIFAPHWVDSCDTFHLECVHCKSEFVSLCIC